MILRLMKHRLKKDVVCKKCGLKYQVSFYVQDSVYTYDEELKKSFTTR